MRIFDGVCQAIEMIEAVGCQPIKILLRGTYHKSTNENASSRQSMCIYITSTGGGSAAPRVAKPDGVVDGIFP